MLKAAYQRVTRCIAASALPAAREVALATKLSHWPALTLADALACAPHRCCSLLKEKEGELHTLAQALLSSETLTQAEIKDLLAGRNSPEAGGGGSAAQLEGIMAVPTPSPAAAVAAAAAAVLSPGGTSVPSAPTAV